MLYGRSHLNASAIIKSVTTRRLRILLLRTDDFLDRMAINPQTGMDVDYTDSKSTLIAKVSRSYSMDESQASNAIKELSDTCDELTDTALESESGGVSLPNGIPASSVDRTKDDAASDEVAVIPDSLPTDAMQICSEAEVHDKVTLSESASGRLKHGLQKYAPVDEDANSPDNYKNQGQTIEVNCVLPSAKYPALSEETVESSETSPDLSPLHALLPCGTVALHEDLSKQPVEPGRPTRISVCRGKCGLGVKVIGGSDTSLKAVMVYEIHDDGAIAKDDRLLCGDQILEINGEDLRNATYSRAVHTFRHTLTDSLNLVVLRDETWNQQDLHDILTVELVKKPSKGLGLSIVSRRHNMGVVIADIVRGGVAESDGRLAPGDQIIAANGEDMSHVTQEFAAAFLKTLMGKVSLTVTRLKSGLIPNQRPNCTVGMKKSESTISDCKNTSRQIAKKPRMTGCASAVACLGYSKTEKPSSDSADASDNKT